MRRFWNKWHTENKKAESGDQAEMLVYSAQSTEGGERYEETFKTFYPVLVAFVIRYVERLEIAEELIQDTFLRLFNHWQRYNQEYKTEGDLKRLVYRIATHIIIDRWRGRRNPGDATTKGDEELQILNTLDALLLGETATGTVDITPLQERVVFLKELIALGVAELGEKNFDIYQMSLLEFDSIDIQQKLKLKSDKQVRTRKNRMKKQIAAFKRKAEGERD